MVHLDQLVVLLLRVAFHCMRNRLVIKRATNCCGSSIHSRYIRLLTKMMSGFVPNPTVLPFVLTGSHCIYGIGCRVIHTAPNSAWIEREPWPEWQGQWFTTTGFFLQAETIPNCHVALEAVYGEKPMEPKQVSDRLAKPSASVNKARGIQTTSCNLLCDVTAA